MTGGLALFPELPTEIFQENYHDGSHGDQGGRHGDWNAPWTHGAGLQNTPAAIVEWDDFKI